MPKQVKARAAQDEREERAVRKLARSQHTPPLIGFGTRAWWWKAGRARSLIRLQRNCTAIPRPYIFTWPVSTNQASRDWGFNRVRDASRG
jgi:hypothetical protein